MGFSQWFLVKNLPCARSSVAKIFYFWFCFFCFCHFLATIVTIMNVNMRCNILSISWGSVSSVQVLLRIRIKITLTSIFQKLVIYKRFLRQWLVIQMFDGCSVLAVLFLKWSCSETSIESNTASNYCPLPYDLNNFMNLIQI